MLYIVHDLRVDRRRFIFLSSRLKSPKNYNWAVLTTDAQFKLALAEFLQLAGAAEIVSSGIFDGLSDISTMQSPSCYCT